MKRIVIANTKGGTGKTTSSIFLASALTARGSVEVWDADPQGSASEWALRAEERDQALGFEVRAFICSHFLLGYPLAYFILMYSGLSRGEVLVGALELSDFSFSPPAPPPIVCVQFRDTYQIA